MNRFFSALNKKNVCPKKTFGGPPLSGAQLASDLVFVGARMIPFLRPKCVLYQRFLHIFDSFVAVGALSKGRSSSWRVNRVLRRVGALLLGTRQRGHYAWTSTDKMPMDGPSRAFERF